MTKGKYAAMCLEECCKFALCDLDDIYLANGTALNTMRTMIVLR